MKASFPHFVNWLALFGALTCSAFTDISFEEYRARAEASRVKFSLSLTNEYVSASPVPIQINVSRGAPVKIAVLVDNANYRAATWTAYCSSIIPVDLGAEGWHEVSIGLCAAGEIAEANPSWQVRRIKLDTTPPLLIVTNPAKTTVSRPMIQLQGYCPEALTHISYDLTNAAGSMTDQQVLVTHEYFDTATWESTTTTFQGYDIDLAKGANVFALHATDRAGNMTMTNLMFTLDYSDATNPPVIQLIWPQNGMALGGDSFTVRGLLNDPTATVAATLTGADGGKKEYRGLVDRNGKFWVENLPLIAATNFLTLTATDAAGNSSATNLTYTKGKVTVRVDAIDSQHLHDITISLSGKVTDPTWSVWINGVKATVRGDGTWTADNVPINQVGTVSFDATAYPPGEGPAGRN